MSDCIREQEALELVRAGRWPDGCDEETRAHIASCASCAECVHVAAWMSADFQRAVRTARVPSSGLVWWRAQRRARQEAERNAARIVTLVQGVSVATGVAVVVGIAGPDTVRRAFELVNFTALSQWSMPVLIGLTAWLAIAPVALYFAVSRD
jgi:hypothetical protein